MSAPPDKLFRAFADRTRLRILRLLTEGELCVCDLMSVLGSAQPHVSRHLGYLRRAGLVAGRQQGLWRYYSLVKPARGLQRRLIDCAAACLDEIDVLKKDRERLRRLRKSGCC
jgi:ArsR family transcriptional regulator, arsenate/arsenite/antimonite-responsive transcriptional repressor